MLTQSHTEHNPPLFFIKSKRITQNPTFSGEFSLQAQKKQFQDNTASYRSLLQSSHNHRSYVTVWIWSSVTFVFAGACVEPRRHAVRRGSQISSALVAPAGVSAVLYAWKFRACITPACIPDHASLRISKSFDDAIDVITMTVSNVRGNNNGTASNMQFYIFHQIRSNCLTAF